MLPISAAELQSLRSEINSTFTDQATVLRPSRPSNSRGGTTTTYVAQPTPVPCIVTAMRIGNRNAKQIEDGQMVAVTTWNISVPVGSDVRVTDRLLVNGVTYEIDDTITASRTNQIKQDFPVRTLE